MNRTVVTRTLEDMAQEYHSGRFLTALGALGTPSFSKPIQHSS